MTWPYGARFKGLYRADKRVSGVFTYPDGRTFEGTCKNERPESGIEKAPDGIFIGEWVDGQFMTDHAEEI